MRLGVVFPQTEITDDPNAVVEYATAVEAAGYAHIEAYDHVLGADPAERPVPGIYTHESLFYEPLVLFSHLAALTQAIEFSTGVLILPQRQTALVAKQASIVQVLSRGRLRLGVGIGWNEREYEALNEDFHNRGRRIEEQVQLLRRLWSEPVVSFAGADHQLTAVGLNPLPQQPIPIWMGGGNSTNAERVLHRIGRLADGWIPHSPSREELAQQLEVVRAGAASIGRDLDGFGVAVRSRIGSSDLDAEVEEALAWRESGLVTHYSVNTMGAGLGSPVEHIRLLEAFIHRYRSAGGAEEV